MAKKNSSNPVKYNHRDIEPRWQKDWEEKKIYSPDMREAPKPFYNLMMFPYPSAEGLHVGNMYAFTGVDVYGRFRRMSGHDVFEPIGLDGFGIHSENYALKVNRHPKEQAKVTAKNFYRQLRVTGNAYDWKRTVETYDPNYYKWTQWLFIQMFKAGLAYRKKAPVNFCPSCKTVLSDEQVIDGRCERCKTLVEKREMEQWFFAITKYAEKLLQNTYQESFHWSEKVKIGQRNWIGKKEGINIRYRVVGVGRGRPDERVSHASPLQIECFTTRPDTNFGATFIVLGPEHWFVQEILESRIKNQESRITEIRAYIEAARKKTDQERIAEGAKKTGAFTGFYAINDLTGKKMPIWISDFVLGNVGTGAVVGVPGHDKRDFQFAKAFGLPIIRVVVGSDGDTSPISKEEQVQEAEGKIVNSDFLNGLDIHQATKEIMDYLEEKRWGKRVTMYKLRDWCISRQRYWGAPIPMVYCLFCADKNIGWLSLNKRQTRESRIKNQESKKEETHNSYFMIHDSNLMSGWFPVPKEQLPVLLPDLHDWKPEGTGKGPLAKLAEFVKVKCPNCGGEAERETDVCDTFLDSSWYFLRYPSVGVGSPDPQAGAGTAPLHKELPWDPEITKKWLPVNTYIGGAEHTVLHLLYARFVTMALKDMGYLDLEEPFSRFYAHGLIIKDGAKMSKSRGNVVVPDEYIAAYGADALRAYLMFLGPFDQGGDFRDTGIAGMYRFVVRVWRMVSEYLEDGRWKMEDGKEVGSSKMDGLSIKPQTSSQASSINLQASLKRTMHKTIKEVTEDMENLRYNTAIAHIMEYVNEIQNSKFKIQNQERKELIEILLLLLAPFMPHMTEELYQKIKNQKSKIKSNKDSIHFHPWPTYDPKMIEEDEVDVVVQVNGKLRETLRIKNYESRIKEAVEEAARKSEKVQRYLEGKKIHKVIFVPGKLINFVI